MSEKMKEASRRQLLTRALVVLGAAAIVQPIGGVMAADGDDDGKKKKGKGKKKKDGDSK